MDGQWSRFESAIVSAGFPSERPHTIRYFTTGSLPSIARLQLMSCIKQLMRHIAGGFRVGAYRVYVPTSHWGVCGVVEGRNTHIQRGKLHGTARHSIEKVVRHITEQSQRTAAPAAAVAPPDELCLDKCRVQLAHSCHRIFPHSHTKAGQCCWSSCVQTRRDKPADMRCITSNG